MTPYNIGPNNEIQVWAEGRIFVAVFDGDVEAAMVAQYARIQREFAASKRAKIIPLTFIRGGVPNVSEEIRDVSVAFFEGAKAYTECGAVVLEAPGMLGGILRSVVTGILLIARMPCPYRIFGTCDPAVAWLREVGSLPPADVAVLTRLVRAADRPARRSQSRPATGGAR
jgi:hypothetical protein